MDEFWEVAEKPDFQLDGVAEEIVAGMLRDLLTARAQIKSEHT